MSRVIIQNIILIVSVLGVIVFGFFIMKRLDKFLNENGERIEKEKQDKKGKEPSCEMLTADLSDEELIERIRTYEKKHGSSRVTLCRDEDELFDGKR